MSERVRIEVYKRKTNLEKLARPLRLFDELFAEMSRPTSSEVITNEVAQDIKSVEEEDKSKLVIIIPIDRRS